VTDIDFDWVAFETALTEAAANAVRTLVESAAGEKAYAVAFSEFYAERSGCIYLPNLALATEESVPDPDCRFSPPDWEYQEYEWGETEPNWGERLTDAVTDLPGPRWDAAWNRFSEAMLSIAAGTRAALVADGTLAPDVVVYLDDEEADLLVRSVTPEELRTHFPAYAAAAAAEHTVLAMPVPRRATELAAAAGVIARSSNHGVDPERAVELLMDLGAAAVPVAITGLEDKGSDWKAAKLLGDLGFATPDVMAALWAALPRRGQGHDWVAAALSSLGSGAEVLARADLPVASRVAAVAAPYVSFRDHARSHRPLDYGLLADGLAVPDLTDELAAALRPGRGYCTPDLADVPAVRAGLEHAEPVIRRHAAGLASQLLGPDRPTGLDDATAQAIHDRLTTLEAEDPDSAVRRLAGYAVQESGRR